MANEDTNFNADDREGWAAESGGEGGVDPGTSTRGKAAAEGKGRWELGTGGHTSTRG